MEHDGCKLCKYENCSMESKECIGCKQNAVDKYTRMTNADRILSMSYEELTEIIMCPYDTAGKPIEIMTCVRDGNVQELVPTENCKKCMMEWLQSEVEE